VGYEILNRMRAMRKLPPLLALPLVPRSLVTAGSLGLGVYDSERIAWRRIEV
jgi:hypothetical protein